MKETRKTVNILESTLIDIKEIVKNGDRYRNVTDFVRQAVRTQMRYTPKREQNYILDKTIKIIQKDEVINKKIRLERAEYRAKPLISKKIPSDLGFVDIYDVEKHLKFFVEDIIDKWSINSDSDIIEIGELELEYFGFTTVFGKKKLEKD